MFSVDIIREMKKVEMESVREKVRQRVRLKSDEEFGIRSVEYIFKVKGLLKRSIFNISSISDFISDSDDFSKVFYLTFVDKIEVLKSYIKFSGKIKKSKKKTMDLDLILFERSDGDISKEKVKKKRLLLQILKFGKDKLFKELKDKRFFFNDILEEKSLKKKKKILKFDKKKKKTMFDLAFEYLDKDLSELNLVGIKERFSSEKRLIFYRRYVVRKIFFFKVECKFFNFIM